jgi:hypothetical protein
MTPELDELVDRVERRCTAYRPCNFTMPRPKPIKEPRWQSCLAGVHRGIRLAAPIVCFLIVKL